MIFKRVVVTGTGALTPIGNNKDEYWANLAKGTSGSAPITKFDASSYRTKFANEVKNFHVNEFIDRREARKMDIFSQYALVVSEEAMRDSQLNTSQVNLGRCGVIWGSGIGGLLSFQDSIHEFYTNNKVPRFSPFFINKMIANLAAGHISIKYGFQGPNYTTVSACASSTHSIYDAFTHIRLGKADVIITGGSEMGICEAGIGGFNAMRALSERNDDPITASRPYDKDRDGFVIGEGAGAIILEEYEHAKKRDAKIYAEVIGGGMSADAYHITMPHPEGEGIIKVMENALKEADISPDAVGYINTHGTSTPLGDMTELKAIQKVFGDSVFKMNISATKSMTGHLLGAAGAIEFIACLLAIEKGVVPPTINQFTPDKELNPRLNMTFNEAQQQKVNIALSNTFGFGGQNCSVIIKKI